MRDWLLSNINRSWCFIGLVLTTFFIMGFQFAAISKTAGTFTNNARRTGWIGFWIMTIGTAMAATMVLIK